MASHGVLCRYMPTALLPIPASNMTTKHTNIYPQCRERNGFGTANGDALMCLAFLRQSGINQPTILDAWIGMASLSMFSRPATTPYRKEGEEPITPRWSYNVLLVTDGGHCKAVERYGAARGIPMDHILCTGRSTLPLEQPPNSTQVASAQESLEVVGREGLGVLSFLDDLVMVLREKRSQLKEPVVVVCPSLLSSSDSEFANSLLPPALVMALQSGEFNSDTPSAPLKPPFAVMATDDSDSALSPPHALSHIRGRGRHYRLLQRQ